MANSRERAARRAGFNPPPCPAPEPKPEMTGKQAAEYRETRQELFEWLLRFGAVRTLQAGALICSGFWFWKHGFPGLIAGAIALFFISKGLPRPSDNLDKHTKR